jgi:hypothetical protein
VDPEPNETNFDVQDGLEQVQDIDKRFGWINWVLLALVLLSSWCIK